MIDTKLIDKLASIAQSVKPIQSARICAAVLHKKDIVAVGVNIKRSHPLQARFSRNAESIFLHAEINAISQAISQVRRNALEDCDLCVVRMIKAKPHKACNEFLPALCCPCEGCWKAIHFFGIKSVTYTLNHQGHLGYWSRA